MVYHCANGRNVNIIKDTVFVNMAGLCDFYIGDTDCTGRRLRSVGYDVSKEKWYEADEPLKKLTPKEEWSLRKGLTYSGSLYNRDGGKITIGLVNAVPPTNIRVTGDGEMLIDENDNSYVYVTKGPVTDEEAAKSGYTVDSNNILCPTVLDGLAFKGTDIDSLEVNGFILPNSDAKNDYNYMFNDSSSSISGREETTNSGSTSSGSTGGGGSSTGSTPTPPAVKKTFSVTTKMRNAYFLSAIYNGESISKLPYSVYEGDSLTEVWFRVAEGYSISGEAKMANGAVLLIMDKHEIEILPITKIGDNITKVTGNITFNITGAPYKRPSEPYPDVKPPIIEK